MSHFLRILASAVLTACLTAGCNTPDEFLRRDFCLEPSELRDCVELSNLPAADHFDRLLGTWTVAADFGGERSVALTSCNLLGPDQESFTFRADSTWTWASGATVRNGTWEIMTIADSRRTFLEGVTVLSEFTRHLNFRCADNLGRGRDERNIDGPLVIFSVE